MPKATKPAKSKKPAETLNLVEPELFGTMRQIFERRGQSKLSLSMMARFALAEWARQQNPVETSTTV